MSSLDPAEFDYLLVGGGLASSLIALAVLEAQPAAKVALIERDRAVGGNHLWCFHAGDVTSEATFVRPLVGATWPRYEVRFPELSRTLEETYAAVHSEQLARVVEAAFASRPHCRLELGRSVVGATAHSVTMDDGRELNAKVVIASQGPERLPQQPSTGYQKFLGLELRLDGPCPIQHPILMDALVPQRDGFRFMYALPFGTDRVLLEDTYFSESPELERAELREEILAYAARQGFRVASVAREEVGVLPLPTRMPDLRVAPEQPLVAGYQGGWFHPVTGYSFPVATRVASAVAACAPQRLRQEVWPRLVREQRAQLRFCLLLNRMFFGAFAPGDRRNVIERFYRLRPELVRRFYALTLTTSDRARIVCGRPPRGFSLARALASGGGSSSPVTSTTGVLS
jgi:lycopene beta-cyclase